MKRKKEKRQIKAAEKKKEGVDWSTVIWKFLRLTLAAVLITGGLWLTYDSLNSTRIQQQSSPSPTPIYINTNGSGASDTAATLLYIINQSGGIPIKVTQSTETNWTQFIISLMLGSIFFLWIFSDFVRTSVKTLIMKSYFKAMRTKTGRHVLLIKHTQQGLFSSSMIDQNTINKIQKALIKFEGKPFDLVLHTPGGEVFSALFISRLFKEYPGKIKTIIPMYAMSGGTLLALSTDEIEMSQTACMGPVDPQLGNLFKYGSAASWDHIVKYKGKKAEDQTISFAMIGRQYTQTIKNHLDKVMTLDMTPDDKKKFINLITSGDIEHAFALTPQELFKMGVPIKYIKDKDILNRLMKFIIRSGNEGVTYA